MKVEVVTLYDLGLKRKINEDNFILSSDVRAADKWDKPIHDSFTSSANGCVFVVADGMGGEAAGEVASMIALNSIKQSLSVSLKEGLTPKDISDSLTDSLLRANLDIKDHVKKDRSTYGMGTTATICYILDNKCYIAWVGDSRVYRFSNETRVTTHDFVEGNLEILTNDHSLVWEEVLRGNMSPEDARVAVNSNVITQSLGDMYKDPVPEIKMYDVYQGDIIIPCSDGLNGMVSDHDMNIIISADKKLIEIKNDLLRAALDGGGSDNITAILIKVVDGKPFITDSAAETFFTGDHKNEKKQKPVLEPKPLGKVAAPLTINELAEKGILDKKKVEVSEGKKLQVVQNKNVSEIKTKKKKGPSLLVLLPLIFFITCFSLCYLYPEKAKEYWNQVTLKIKEYRKTPNEIDIKGNDLGDSQGDSDGRTDETAATDTTSDIDNVVTNDGANDETVTVSKNDNSECLEGFVKEPALTIAKEKTPVKKPPSPSKKYSKEELMSLRSTTEFVNLVEDLKKVSSNPAADKFQNEIKEIQSKLDVQNKDVSIKEREELRTQINNLVNKFQNQ